MFKKLKMEEIIQEIEKQAKERSKVYRLLSMFFLKNPSNEFLKKIKDDEFLENILRICDYGEEEFKKPVSYIKNFLESAKRNNFEDKILESLQVDFTKLTRGIKRGYGPPPPYESVWRGSSSIMSEWTEKVLRFYAEAKIGMDLEDELPDHIGIELKFMSLLCYKEMEMWNKGKIESAFEVLERENDFLKFYLLAWTPFYLNEMEKEAETDFYKGVALLTKSFLYFDKEVIEEIYSELKDLI
ncbi:chaperone TorD involved in molybdoenzyme TorA maturation [Candidatus Kryptonium thompsonii]|uniref:Chaperone TorD involved in molybdoenzyme TorA maturation n=2 Tax=Candidatus Kryptonium thompsonii TaxID=1633631 RepID=A0A0P1MFK8_9BACT|nr:molecular chaperone TorD family protein [Candidatus Kryptonium thompsoni]CUS85123.1 chaperone TorD involved in molybdoenzyme TorA maturation [Candidatus Kryptonium thompsoni]CUS85902.1 chaperone TorD involved in molybdoenzyme TorA maturation [Candidatus Kryptonium thompsoni]CUS91215.1 chaperone TorD involved in molybdoenzyme TorA maturation [Candidatus Kryptonium thompsoni]CUS91614.1 chaperone TorD involved in molybdoenzyme TorA maturation [Candidatus Kryptonium thompsoni]CUS93794.1 chapero